MRHIHHIQRKIPHQQGTHDISPHVSHAYMQVCSHMPRFLFKWEEEGIRIVVKRTSPRHLMPLRWSIRNQGQSPTERDPSFTPRSLPLYRFPYLLVYMGPGLKGPSLSDQKDLNSFECKPRRNRVPSLPLVPKLNCWDKGEFKLTDFGIRKCNPLYILISEAWHLDCKSGIMITLWGFSKNKPNNGEVAQL